MEVSARTQGCSYSVPVCLHTHLAEPASLGEPRDTLVRPFPPQGDRVSTVPSESSLKPSGARAKMGVKGGTGNRGLLVVSKCNRGAPAEMKTSQRSFCLDGEAEMPAGRPFGGQSVLRWPQRDDRPGLRRQARDSTPCLIKELSK